MHVLALVAFVALSGTAMAQCPSRDALQEGGTAYASYPDGGIVGLRWMGARMIQETTRYRDGGNEFRMISMGGIFIIDEVNLDGEQELSDSRIATRYSVNIYDQLPVTSGARLAVTAVNSFADGTDPEEERIELRTGGLAEVDIAGCRYEGFPMLITYHWAEEYFTSMMTHLPALGLSLEVARLDQEGTVQPFAPLRFDLTPP